MAATMARVASTIGATRLATAGPADATRSMGSGSAVCDDATGSAVAACSAAPVSADGCGLALLRQADPPKVHLDRAGEVVTFGGVGGRTGHARGDAVDVQEGAARGVDGRRNCEGVLELHVTSDSCRR